MLDPVFTSYSQLQELAQDTEIAKSGLLRPSLVGLLFMRSGQAIVDKEILPSLSYFHERSGPTRFFLPGWHVSYSPAGKGTEKLWGFNEQIFVSGCKALSEGTTWSYSGGVDLLR